MFPCRLLPLLALSSLVTPIAPFQEGSAADPKAVDLRVFAEVGRKMLIETDFHADVELAITNAAGKKSVLDLSMDGEHKVVDEYIHVKDGESRATRRIVAWQLEDGRKTKESEFIGARWSSPKEKMSARVSTGCPRACSGAM